MAMLPGLVGLSGPSDPQPPANPAAVSSAPALSPGDKMVGQQNLGSPHSGMRTAITPGDTLARSMGNYGKAPPALNAGGAPSVDLAPKMKDAAAGIRGGTGMMRKRVSKGGFGGTTTPGSM